MYGVAPVQLHIGYDFNWKKVIQIVNLLGLAT